MKFLKFTTYFFLAMLCMVVFSAQAQAATAIYYSVGQNTTSHETDLGTVTVDATARTATFTVPQIATNMGVGDLVTYAGGSCYIFSKTSTSVWGCQNATGGAPIAVTDAEVTSIAHAFASLNAAEIGAPALLGTADLVVGNYQLNFPCYFDTGADTTGVTISAYTTSASNHVRIYTPNNTSTEVNLSQRHVGAWDETKYSLQTTGRSIDALNGYVKVDGLQMRRIANDTSWEAVMWMRGTEQQVSNSIITASFTGTSSNDYGVLNSAANLLFFNNIIYGISNGLNLLTALNENSAGSIYVYNNTITNSYRGIDGNSNTIAKNNIVQNCGDGFTDSFDAASNYNISDLAADAPGINSKNSTTVAFADVANKNFHLAPFDIAAKNAGADLSADANFAFSTDIDGQTRLAGIPPAGGWDIGADEAATQVFYSVGQSASDLKTGTNPTINIISGAAVFSEAQTGNIGVGDRVTYNTNQIAYISTKTSADRMHWSLVTATGAPAGDITNSVVVSIKHEYTSLSAAVTGAMDTDHLNTSDLAIGNYQLNFPCYYDSGADTATVTVSGYATSVGNYIKIYTPFNTATEANNSQRHQGKWDEERYRLEVTNSRAITGVANFFRLDGLQIKAASDSLTAGATSLNGVQQTDFTDIQASNNLVNVVRSAGAAYTYGISAGRAAGVSANTIKVWNNIVFGSSGSAGIHFGGPIAYVYNNTVSGVIDGYYADNGSLMYVKNSIAQNCNRGFYGAHASSNYNISDLVADAPGVNSKNSTTVTFLDAANKDFHLSFLDTSAKNAGLNLQADPFLHFSQDIDGQERSGIWDIGADENIEMVQQKQLSTPGLDTGLVGHWTFDGSDVNGNVAKDISGNKNDGTIAGATVTPGKLGQGLNYVSLGSVVSVPDNDSLEGMTQLTLSAWINPRTSGNFGRIIEKGNGTPYNFYFIGSNLQCDLDSTSVITASNPFSGKYNSWHLATCVYDGVTVAIYLDGALIASAARTGSVATGATAVTIGNNDSGARTFDGVIDDARIYNRALSGSEISQLYNLGQTTFNTAQIDKSTNGLIGMWSFDGADVSGNTAFDRSGNGNNGTIAAGQTPTVGKNGQAIDFNGAGNVALPASAILRPTNALSVAGWIKADSLTQWDALIGNTDTVWQSGMGVFYDVSNGGELQFFVNSYDNNVAKISFNDTQNWHYLVGTWDGSVVDIYVDGVKGVSDTYAGSIAYNDDLYIGAIDSPNSYSWDGKLDEFRMYNRGLSAKEVSDLYNAGKVETRK
ncbi:MAG: LamG domain-containing protein [Candidatus Moranbacteria bacterium]|nr:LamG domain-containing protein [Candidatus Moranbacteria bacterium]